MSGIVGYEEFKADCDHPLDKPRRLHISGIVCFATSGWTAQLRRQKATGNSGTSPLTLRLDLLVTAPASGTPVTAAITRVPVELSLDDPAHEYIEVVFADVIGVDEAPRPPRIEVVHPQLA